MCVCMCVCVCVCVCVWSGYQCVGCEHVGPASMHCVTLQAVWTLYGWLQWYPNVTTSVCSTGYPLQELPSLPSHPPPPQMYNCPSMLW